MNPHVDIERIGGLVIDGDFRQAFQELPPDIRNQAISRIRGGILGSVRIAMVEESRQDPEEYRNKIIEELTKETVAGISAAALLIAGHLENVAVTKRGAPASPEELPKGQKKPPYYPLEKNPEFHPWPESYASLAKEAYAKTGPIHDWLSRMQNTFQAQSVLNASFFAKSSVEGLAWDGRSILKEEPRAPLTPYESNALYHQPEFIKAIQGVGETLAADQSFSHLIEFVIVELLESFKGHLGIERVSKASREEDIFLGTDVALKLKNGKWIAVDLTTSNNPYLIQQKREKGKKKGDTVYLPNISSWAKEGKSVNAIPIVQPVNKELFVEVTKRYLESMKRREGKSLAQIFSEVARQQGKNPAQEIRGLWNWGAAA